MTAPEWSLRLARPGDAEQFSEVEEDAARLLAEEPSLAGIAMPPSRSAAEYRAIIAQRQSLSATFDENVIGFAAARPAGRELHLHELSVARAFQRRRIGSTLLRALKIDAANAGFAAITLHTFRDIAWNAPFYAGHGFTVVEDVADHARLSAGLEAAIEAGLPGERRCAMICPLNR
ncbi:GNAT family N-acetyltransferase [Aurantiacibacter zhengii]|uniref:N-acetyltransferase n=1 Tax=Aurantiacibacter zhengii TaxID=2307003 RepID=A0A418NQI6_9SPHN|nr:GNAT family N-acetyltransferase [Aurantiacibacter zhengii]RIV85064.1 N-acetyltransferase [Aurantiacibacter zhengii]